MLILHAATNGYRQKVLLIYKILILPRKTNGYRQKALFIYKILTYSSGNHKRLQTESPRYLQNTYSSGNHKWLQTESPRYLQNTYSSGNHKRLIAPYLCSFSTGAGSLSPGNYTLQLHDRSGSGDDNDDESGDRDEARDDGVSQVVKDLGVVPIKLCGHQFVHRDVGLRVDG